MKIQLPVAALKPALQGFSKVISARTSLPVLNHLLLESETNSTRLTATNLEDFVTHRVENTPVFERVSGLVPFEPLQRIARECARQDQIMVEFKEAKAILSYTVGASIISQAFLVPPVGDFPPIPNDPHCLEEAVHEDFKAALLQGLECASDDWSRAILQNVYVDLAEANAQYVVGTDGRQLFSANSFKLPWKQSFLLPRRKFLAWDGFAGDGPWRIGLLKVKESGYVKVSSPSWKLVTRMAEGDYPNWKQVMPSQPGQTRVTLDAESSEITKAALKRLPAGHSNMVQLSLKSGSALVLSTQTSEQSASFPVTGAKVQGPDMIIAVNRDYLLRALKFGLTEWEMETPFKPLVCLNGGRRMLIMPMRIEGSPEPEPAALAGRPEPREASEASHINSSMEIETKGNTMQVRTTDQTNNVNDPAGRLQPDPKPAESAFAALSAKIEGARTSLRSAAIELGEALAAVKAVEKEKRSGERDLEAVRSTLRSLQKVQI